MYDVADTTSGDTCISDVSVVSPGVQKTPRQRVSDVLGGLVETRVDRVCDYPFFGYQAGVRRVG